MFLQKRDKHNCFIRLLKRAPMVSVFLIVACLPFTANALDILIGTGESGTFSHFAGRTICRIINKHTEGFHCKTVPARDAVYQITNLQGGSLDMGLIDSLMLHDAIHKTGDFAFLDIHYDNLRVLVPLYDVPIALLVREDADINALAQLKGKRINAGAPRSMQHRVVDMIMKAKNWTRKDFSLLEKLPGSQSQDTMAFCHGTIQAMVHIGVHPDASLKQLFRLCKARMVNMNDNDIEKLVKDHPAFLKITIPTGIYPSLSRDVNTFGTSVTLVASGDLDDESVFKIIEALDRNRKTLNRAHPALSGFSLETAKARDAVIQRHPGIAEYFSEQEK